MVEPQKYSIFIPQTLRDIPNHVSVTFIFSGNPIQVAFRNFQHWSSDIPGDYTFTSYDSKAILSKAVKTRFGDQAILSQVIGENQLA